MTRIPFAPLALGLAGLIPFIWGAATSVSPNLADLSDTLLPQRFSGRAVLQAYGLVILSFMAGVIWGFGTRATPDVAARYYGLSVVPPLWAFFLATGSPGGALLPLALGFMLLLPIDWAAMRAGLAPRWWMPLRLLLTTIVVICLAVGLAAGSGTPA